LQKRLKFSPAPDEKSNDWCFMVITPFYTQKILQAYNQQMTLKTRVSSGKGKELIPRDSITISAESRKRLATANGGPKIVNNLTNPESGGQQKEQIRNP
jgi:hypothetical protein